MKIILKKSIIASLLIIVALLLICTCSYGTTGTVTATSLRVRKEASKDADIITTIQKGKEVEIISTVGDDWYKISYGNTTGYVSAEYIDKKETQIEQDNNQEEINANEDGTKEEEKSKTEENEEETEENSYKILISGTKVYITPLINANVIIIQDKNTQVEVITELNGWAYIYSDTLTGWVRSDKLYNESELTTKAYISASQVNLRKEASKTAESLIVMSRNAEVKVITQDDEWSKIEYFGKTGYVLTQYLSKEKVQTTSRSSVNRKSSTASSSTNKVSNTTTTKIASTSTANTTSEKKTSSSTDTSLGQKIVNYAKTFIGGKYVYGGTTPSGFDCSGFTQYVFKHFGYSLSRTASAQASNGKSASTSSLQVGDLLCFSNSSKSKSINHVGIYMGSGRFIHAANTQKGIITSNISGDGFYLVKARRII